MNNYHSPEKGLRNSTSKETENSLSVKIVIGPKTEKKELILPMPKRYIVIKRKKEEK